MSMHQQTVSLASDRRGLYYVCLADIVSVIGLVQLQMLDSITVGFTGPIGPSNPS
jgi:hypothetical protein